MLLNAKVLAQTRCPPQLNNTVFSEYVLLIVQLAVNSDVTFVLIETTRNQLKYPPRCY